MPGPSATKFRATDGGKLVDYLSTVRPASARPEPRRRPPEPRHHGALWHAMMAVLGVGWALPRDV
eukprot:6275194-Alexandrium_andersonii.AAC.1